MGQIADDLIEGKACQLCGQYFFDPVKDKIYEHGYPVVCHDCWADLTKPQKKGYQKAEVQTI